MLIGILGYYLAFSSANMADYLALISADRDII